MDNDSKVELFEQLPPLKWTQNGQAVFGQTISKKHIYILGMLGKKKSWMYIQKCRYVRSVSTCVNACIEKKILLLV